MGLLDGTSQNQYYTGNTFGDYQFTSLDNIINQFMIAYVGENKIISKIKKVDVAFHAQRALQELSFDTLKSIKAQEIIVPATLQMLLPQDYVNYTKISWVDSAGIKHLLYPASKTSNPTNPIQNDDGDFILQAVGTLSSSATIVLDKEYKNIAVGMTVSSPSIPLSSQITSVTNSGGITTIVISGVTTYTGDETIIFTKNGILGTGLIPQEDSAFILETLTIVALTNKITASSIADAAQIKVGMLVSSIDFAPGTTVIDVNGAVITTSADALTATSTEVTFISTDSESDTWSSYKSATPSENQDDYQDNTYWPMNGSRFGLDPQHAQANGSFYIDNISGKIHFSSNISGKTVILDYISDTLGTDNEMQVHKFAEEAMYKCIAYAVLSTSSSQLHQQLAPRFKKEKFATTRQAKLRLSNIKLEELTQILRGKSKQIKH